MAHVSGQTPYRGYYFVELSKNLNSKFEYALLAVPDAQSAGLGALSFYTDQTGTIWRKKLKGPLPMGAMSDPAADGWTTTGS